MYRQMYMGGGQGIMSLDAGAPSIKYTGNIDPNKPTGPLAPFYEYFDMEKPKPKPETEQTSAPDPMADLYNQFLNMKKQGIIPQDMDFESFKDLIREQVAYGGQMRQQYGLGSIVKKAVKGVTNVVKDVVKSDIGKAALLGAGAYYLGGGTFGGLRPSAPGFAFSNLPGYTTLFGSPATTMPTMFGSPSARTPGLLSKFLPKTTLGRTGVVAAIGGLTGFLSSQGKSEEEIEAIKRDPQQLSGYLRQYFINLNPRASEKQISDFVQTNLGEYQYAVGGRVGYSEGSSDEEDDEMHEARELAKKEGITLNQALTRMLEERFGKDRSPIGRTNKAYGDTAQLAAGIEGLPFRQNSAGVGEVDMRETGGFIPPVGVKEKADDIPAMLSNNEFVFTADAVRGMGNGDVNLGAQRMYDMMKKLENGGRV